MLPSLDDKIAYSIQQPLGNSILKLIAHISNVVSRLQTEPKKIKIKINILPTQIGRGPSNKSED